MPVPKDLVARFERWDADGRPLQEAFPWKAASWSRHLGDREVLNRLPNPLGRADVARVFETIDSPTAALDAYIASYVWGYAKAGFGPYRAARVIAAYAHVGRERAASRVFFRRWGPAFGTKFIHYATKASTRVPTTPIMDAVVQRWFADKSDGVGALVLDWRAVDSYRRYCAFAAEWGEALRIEPDEVELLIFRPEPAG